MRMTINKAGYHPPATNIELPRAGRSQFIQLTAERKNAAAANQQVTDSEIFRGKNMGICDELQHLGARRKRADILHYRFIRQQTIAA
jgi:hypothetical protein